MVANYTKTWNSLRGAALALLLSAAAVLTVAPAYQPVVAQVENSQLTGIVTDTTGAVISGATVVARNTDTGLTKTAVSSRAGEFTVPNIPPGAYKVTVSYTGFSDYTETVAVAVGGALKIEAKLGVTAQGSTIEVSSQDMTVQVNTTNQEVSQVITPRQLMDLPTLTRNPYDFVVLSGNVAADPNGSTGNQGVGVSISGQRSASTDILLDGVENVNSFSASTGQQIPLDGVAEYRIITNGFTAQYGRATGGVVNLVTKSGTNSFHGSFYEYNRISALASNTYNENALNFASKANGTPLLPPDHFTRNQFGYSVGGPVMHDKLFFFSNTEWNRIRSAGAQFAVIPTASFIASSAPATQAFFAKYGKIAPGVAPGQLISVAKFVGPAPLQQVSYSVASDAGAGTPVNAYDSLNRMDWTISQKTNLFFRYVLYNDLFPPGTNNASPYAGYSTGSQDRNQAFLLAVNHSFTSSLISSTKVSFNRLNNLQPLGAAPVGPTLYLNRSNTASVDAVTGTNIALPGYSEFSPGNAIPFGGPQNFYQFGEDLNWVKHNHDLHVGGQFIQLRDNRVFGAYEESVEQIAKQGVNEGTALTDLQQGSIYSFQGAINPQGKFPCYSDPTTGKTIVTAACTVSLPVSAPAFGRENTFNDGNAYVQDNWKITPRFTASLGLRWEYYGVQHNTKPSQESNFFLGTGSSIFQQIRNGQVLSTPNSPVGGIIEKKFNNYGPRVGFAWDLFGNGKWAVRGGYGISYERNFGNVTFNVIQNPPAYAVVSLIAGPKADVPFLPVYTDNSGPLAGSGSKALPKVSLRAPLQSIPVAYSNQYDFSIQHEIAPGAVLSVDYSGTRGIHQYSIANINQLYSGQVYLGDANPGNRINNQYSNINQRQANGDNFYNAVDVHLEYSRFEQDGLQLTSNYTYSRSIDNLSSTFSQSGNNFNLGYLNPFKPSLDHGNADYDIRNHIVVAAIYEPKFLEFKDKGAIVHALLGGLQFAPIFTARTGSAFTIYDCTNAVSGCPRIVAAPGLKYHGTPVANGQVNQFNYITIPTASMNPYTDPIAGASDVPTCGLNGCTQNPGLGRNQWYGPGAYNLNLGVYKNFAIHERYEIQLRSEFYNALNHHNYYAVAGNADYASQNTPGIPNPVFAVKGAPGGTPSAADERRNVQLAIRLQF